MMFCQVAVTEPCAMVNRQYFLFPDARRIQGFEKSAGLEKAASSDSAVAMDRPSVRPTKHYDGTKSKGESLPVKIAQDRAPRRDRQPRAASMPDSGISPTHYQEKPYPLIGLSLNSDT